MLKWVGIAIAVFAINIVLLFVTVKPVYAPSCAHDNLRKETYALRLEHGKTLYFDFTSGQQVMLAGDAEGKLGLQANSVVGVYLSPSSKGVGYSMETLPPQDISSLLLAGKNEVRLVAVDTSDTAYLVITSSVEGCEA